MKKPNLEHIAPYLPYGLKAQFPYSNKKGCKSKVIGTIHAIYSDSSIICHDTVNASPDTYKPLLVPLEKYKDVNSPEMNRLNCDITHQLEISDVANNNLNVENMTVWAYRICLENHIDLFGLIDKKLAIEKN